MYLNSVVNSQSQLLSVADHFHCFSFIMLLLLSIHALKFVSINVIFTRRAAKAALLLPVSNLTVPHSDYKSLLRTQALKQGQLLWNSETENKLHAIEPWVNAINLLCLHRRDEIIIHRLSIGLTYLTYGHLKQGETPPWCLDCQIKLTVEHILLHSVSFTNTCDDFFCVTFTSMSPHV